MCLGITFPLISVSYKCCYFSSRRNKAHMWQPQRHWDLSKMRTHHHLWSHNPPTGTWKIHKPQTAPVTVALPFFAALLSLQVNQSGSPLTRSRPCTNWCTARARLHATDWPQQLQTKPQCLRSSWLRLGKRRRQQEGGGGGGQGEGEMWVSASTAGGGKKWPGEMGP